MRHIFWSLVSAQPDLHGFLNCLLANFSTLRKAESYNVVMQSSEIAVCKSRSTFWTLQSRAYLQLGFSLGGAVTTCTLPSLRVSA
jgi:hypothetical protein